MRSISGFWTREHDLALVYIAFAFGAVEELDDNALAIVTDVLQDWRADFPPDLAQDVVMEAVDAYVSDETESILEAAVSSLGEKLSPDERLRALEHILRIAEVDDVLVSSEAYMIQKLAASWEIRATAKQLLMESTSTVALAPEWNLLHDIGLLYVVLAHAGDGELTPPELELMQERLTDWQPDMSRAAIRSVLSTAMTFYQQGPNLNLLQGAVASMRDKMPAMHRLLLLDDMLQIAEADGSLAPHEKEIIQSFSEAWGVRIFPTS